MEQFPASFQYQRLEGLSPCNPSPPPRKRTSPSRKCLVHCVSHKVLAMSTTSNNPEFPPSPSSVMVGGTIWIPENLVYTDPCGAGTSHTTRPQLSDFTATHRKFASERSSVETQLTPSSTGPFTFGM